MGTKFTYALILTLAGAGLNLLLYFTGYQTEKLATGQHLQWLGFLIMAVVLFLGVKAVREESPGQYLSFGRGVGAGVLISLFSGLMSAVYSFIHFKYINTEFADYQMEIVRAKWEQAGMSSSQIEQADGVARLMMGPVAQAILTPFLVVIIGLVFSLVIAAILKRPPPPEMSAG